MTAKLRSEFAHYKSWVFDCDGVLLDSNHVKTEAFRSSVLDYGIDQADQLAAYNVKYGGISRFIKFNYFFENILGREPQPGELDAVLDRFSKATTEGMLECDEGEGLRDLLHAIASDISKIVASGGMQSELHEIFAQRGLGSCFTGIYGSPDNKETIINRERKNGIIVDPAIYVGDSKYDYEAALRCGLDFVFVSGWSEFKDWENFFTNKNVKIENNLTDLITK